MARTVAIMLGLAAQQEAVESLIGPDRVDPVRAAGEHLVDVTLVGNIENKLVLRCRKHPVQGHGQLDHAEIGTQVSAGFRQGINQRVPDLRGQFRQILISELLDIAR